MIAAHLGVIDEEKINDMSYIFFEDVLTELGYKLNFEAIANYAGNSFVEKSWEMIQDSNPMMINGDGKAGNRMSRSSQQAMMSFFGDARVATAEELAAFKEARGIKTHEKT